MLDYGNAFKYRIVRTGETKEKMSGGGKTFTDNRDGAVYTISKNDKGQWTIYSQSPKWAKRDEFENGLASEEDAIMLAKLMSGIKKEREPKFAEGGKIETKIKKKLSSSFALPLQMAVYVPSTEKASQIISKKDFNNRVDEVENYLSDLFGGFSATSVEGGYLSDNKGLIQEDVVKVTAFSGKDGFEDKFAKLLDRIKSWCNNWGQESMGFEFEGELFYIDKDAKFAKGGRTNKYEIYHDTLSSALEEIEAYAHSGGYEFTEDHYTPDVTNGGIPYGQTARIQRGIHKEGKKKDGVLLVQIYRMDNGKYELNGYPSY